MSVSLNRRTFLRGSAGALLPLPFLNLMEASAKTENEGKPPVRFMALFKPNGVHPPTWNIEEGSEFDFRMTPMMKSFEKHKDDLLVLDNIGDFGFASHANSSRRFLSGHHQNTKTASIDQIIADKIGGDTPHKSLELTTEGLFPGQIGCSYISYDQNGQPIPRESDPQLIFDRLFNNPLSHPQKRKQMASLLDRVNEDAKSLSRKAGAEDQQVLDQYLTVVRETEKRLQTMKAASTGPIDFTKLERPEGGGSLDDQVESMLDLIALAMWTDQSRCISYMLGNSNSRMIFDFLGVKEQHHYLSHFFRNFSPTNIVELLKVCSWHMEKFDSLLNRLKSYKDHNGTLLEHSVVLFGSGMGHSDNHTVKRIPMVLAGQGGGMIKTGRYLRYAENQPVGKLHLALLQQFGVDTDSYGMAETPLAGLDGSPINFYEERAFDTWVKHEDKTITVQGRLRLSDDLNQAKIFFVDVKGKPAVRLEIGFRDFHDFNLAYHCGTPITLTGNGTLRGEELVITKVTKLESVFGKLPGKANG
ncbi:MAG: hypothetical protein COA78_34705 [Blastopirellula sp.]|nr:MAG: hypothetical protein COA78_34705 [Blastopirellula sp.]